MLYRYMVYILDGKTPKNHTDETMEQRFYYIIITAQACIQNSLSDKAPLPALRLMNRDYTSLFVLISDHVGVLCTNKHKDRTTDQ